MSPRRPVILLGLLLALQGGGLYCSVRDPPPFDAAPRPTPAEPPLAGTNAISNLRVKHGAGDVWIADFDYFFTGEPATAAFRLTLLPQTPAPNASAASSAWATFVPPPQRGAQHVSIAINYPGSALSTRILELSLRRQWGARAVIAAAQVDAAIDWPDFQTWFRTQQLARSSATDNLNQAIAMIDGGDEPQRRQAQWILERLIDHDSRLDAAYVQLARIAIDAKRGTDGLHQAENLLLSALAIQPGNSDATILLGYVYAHQRRFALAHASFAAAAAAQSANPWLAVNWAELLVMQGEFDQAAVKYREVLAAPVNPATSARPRVDAYAQLLEILRRRRDLDGMEALYRQRTAEFGPAACASTDYALFLLQERGNAQAAIDLSRRALSQNCDDDKTRQTLGLSEYVKWASSSGAERTDSLNQARIFLPPGPKPLYLLATSAQTMPAAEQLIAAGEPVDQRDNDRQTALAYALQNHDLAAARRLLMLGARPETPVGDDDLPVALLPVIEGNLAATRLMKRFGADYASLRYRGASAQDVANRSGNSALLEALGRRDTVL